MDERDVLIGREPEVAAVLGALKDHRLVTITGLGGVGKTRLARELADRLSAAGQMVAFVDLAPVSSAPGVLDAVAAQLGVLETPTTELEAAIVDRLLVRRMVLVLDNLEHLLEARAALRRMLDSAAELTLLATSRVALGLTDEHEIRLDSLAGAQDDTEIETAPATQLFLRRARDRGHLRSLDPQDVTAVADLCRRLDGLPLAIELAAAWTGVLTPRAIARRIGDPTLALADDQEPRHVSLEQVVTTTLGFTSDDDRAVFDRLGVFVDTFDDAAVGAVCDGGPEVLAALRHLEAVSLVRVSADDAGEPRFALLETIRAIARARLTVAGTLVEAEARHGSWYAARSIAAADELRSHTFNEPDASGRLADPNNIVAFERAMGRGDAETAGRVAAALASYGIQAGILRETVARLELALALRDVSAGTRSDLLLALVNLRAALGELDTQVPDALEALDLARRAGSDIRVVRALIALGSWTQVDSEDRLREAAALAEAIGYEWGALAAWNNLANVLADQGRLEEAIETYGTAIRLAEASGDPAGASLSLMSRGVAELELGQTERALADVRDADRRLPADDGGSVAFRLWTATTLAMAEAETGLVADAAVTLAATVDTVVRLDSPQEVDGWLDAAFAVLAGPRPALAARCLGALDAAVRSEGSVMADSRLNRRIAARLEIAIGRHRLAVKRAEGRAMDRELLFGQVADAVRAEARRGGARVVAPYGDLTPRELTVLDLLARGRTDPEIGAELGIAPKTASVHVANLKAKLGVETRVAAVLFARDHLGEAD